MEIRAHLRFLHIAPRKVRLVTNFVKGMPVDRAIDQLTVLNKQAARPVKKLIDSAIANAVHNFQIDRTSLKIKSIVTNEGPRLKRWRPRAFGRAAPILKRMSHVTVVLDGQVAKTASPTAKPAAANKVSGQSVKRTGPKTKTRTTVKKPTISTAEEQSQKRTGSDPEIARKGES